MRYFNSEKAFAKGLRMESCFVKESKIPWFVLNTPELGRPFNEFYEACRKQSVLDRKTKELLMLVLASSFRSQNRVEEHIESAMDAGASREEITEAILIAASEAANAQIGLKEEIYNKFLR
jgi:alkylhydroperoxidase/carboxymuconolactone decarboxylase family protein YurZ